MVLGSEKGYNFDVCIILLQGEAWMIFGIYFSSYFLRSGVSVDSKLQVSDDDLEF